MTMPESIAARIRNSTKCQWVGCSNDSEIFALKMAEAVGIEVMLTFTYAPPLAVYREAVEAAFRFAEAGQPIRILSGQVMGGSGPATIAGGVVTNNAEVISGVVLTQLIKPGTRVLVKDFAFPLDMRSGAPVFGSIETCLHNAVSNQIFRRYGVPIDNGTCYPSAKMPDYQCGYEKALRVLVAGLSGASTLLLHSGVYGELSGHPVQTILDEGYLKVMGKGKKEHIVPIGNNAQRALQRYLFRFRPKPTNPVTDNVFLSISSKALTENSMKLMFTRLAKRSGVCRLHAHLCRHTFATRFLINGGDVFSLQQILGHSTLEMVRHYVNLASSHIAIQHQKFSPLDRLNLRG